MRTNRYVQPFSKVGADSRNTTLYTFVTVCKRIVSELTLYCNSRDGFTHKHVYGQSSTSTVSATLGFHFNRNHNHQANHTIQLNEYIYSVIDGSVVQQS
jgi:hypothetical protein